MKEKSKKFEEYLEELYPNVKCELNYKKDYELLLAVVMSAQTTDKRVNQVNEILFSKYPTLKSLYEANINDIMEIIKPIGTFHKKAKFIQEIAFIIDSKYEGVVPNNRKILESLPGVGRKTCNVILSELFMEPNIAVDTHVERVSKRLGFNKKNDSVLKVEEKLEKLFSKDVWSRRHLQMVFYGRYHCKAMRPNCKDCKMKDVCLYYKEKKN